MGELKRRAKRALEYKLEAMFANKADPSEEINPVRFKEAAASSSHWRAPSRNAR